MKRFLALLLTIVMVAVCFTGCRHTNNKSGKLSIVTTIFPEYDFVREIMGEKFADADVKLLLDNGVDLHSYQPTAKDIVAISNCDMFVYIGGESDEWAEDILEDAKNRNMQIVKILGGLSSRVLVEEQVEGMQVDDDHEHYDDDKDFDLDDIFDKDDDDEHDDDIELDEHVWLSLKEARLICESIAGSLCVIDPENSDIYKANLKAYGEKLSALDIEYESAVKSGKFNTLLFADRFPFRYLVDDYGLKYYAAFMGCSAESEASFETISFLANKVNELGLSTVLTIEGGNQKIAKTVVEASKKSDVKILTLDSMQTASSADIKNNKTYLSIAQNNLEVLKKALN